MEDRKVDEGYVITQRWDDFKALDVASARTGVVHLLERLPAFLLRSRLIG